MEDQENTIQDPENQENSINEPENQDNIQEPENQESSVFESENQENDFQGTEYETSSTFTGNQFNSQIPVPNSTLILILGIASIVTCCCYGLIGIICAIITLVLAKTAKQTYEADPSLYTPSSYSNVNAGRVCGIIGLAMSAVYIVMIIIVMIVYGVAALANPEQFMNM